MTHWAEKYVGLAYDEAEFDCAELARRVQFSEFGKKIALPSARDYHGLQGLAKVNAQTAQIDRLKYDYARRITRRPREGDGVLLISRGRLKHIGIYCLTGGAAWVLHAASAQRQVVMTRVSDLENRGLLLEGYYEWI